MHTLIDLAPEFFQKYFEEHSLGDLYSVNCLDTTLILTTSKNEFKGEYNRSTRILLLKIYEEDLLFKVTPNNIIPIKAPKQVSKKTTV